MPKKFPSKPNLEQLKKRAKVLLRTHKSGGKGASDRFLEYHPRFSTSSASDIQRTRLSLADAQLVIAREYGFSSWPELKHHIESIRDSSTVDDSLDSYELLQTANDTVTQFPSTQVTRTFGRFPTLGEMKDYYARDDVVSFLYDECRMRNVEMAYSKKRWAIRPTSKDHLRQIIEKTTKDEIGRAYRKSPGLIDDVRLKKFEYISFHSRTTITAGGRLTGFDIVFEADVQGWRRAFEILVGAVRILDDFGVCYRIKYSGVRSLHLMIPFESLPKQFNGKPILSQRGDIRNRLGDYLRKHCDMGMAHSGSIMRLGYSLNEDNGLVSLPITSDELNDFRPWETNMYNVSIDKPWHGNIPEDASRNMLKFLREIYKDNSKTIGINSGLEIAPKERSRYVDVSDGLSVEELAVHLRSDDSSERLKAAWNLMIIPDPVPISVVEEGLADENPDVRWYLTESLQKSLSDSAIKLAARMLRDDDQFVRIGAIDTLVLAGEKALDIILNSMSGDDVPTIWALNDAVYALQKIRSDSEAEEMKLFLRSARYTIAGLMVEELDLCVRTANSLEAADIVTIRDLVTRSEPEMLKFRNFGPKSLNEVKTVLGEIGLSFGMILDGNETVEVAAESTDAS